MFQANTNLLHQHIHDQTNDFEIQVLLFLGGYQYDRWQKFYHHITGVEVTEEAYSKDAGKHYVTLLARFSGECRDISELEAEFGIADTPARNTEAKIGYLKTKLAVFEKRRNGIERSTLGGEDYTPHVEYIKTLINEEERRLK